MGIRETHPELTHSLRRQVTLGEVSFVPKQAGQALLEDDRNYFRAGATRIDEDSFTILLLEGSQHIPAGCLIEIDHAPSFSELADISHALTRLEAAYVRFYLPGEIKAPHLEGLGFQRLTEAALAKPVESPLAYSEAFTVRPITKADDDIKIKLLASDTARPDGKTTSAHDYVAMERAKIDAGYMTAYMVEYEGVPSACYALSSGDNFVRMKNLFTHARLRGRGCGTVIVRHAEQVAAQLGKAFMGVFGMPESAGMRLYRRTGHQQVGTHTEFIIARTQLAGALAARGVIR